MTIQSSKFITTAVITSAVPAVSASKFFMTAVITSAVPAVSVSKFFATAVITSAPIKTHVGKITNPSSKAYPLNCRVLCRLNFEGSEYEFAATIDKQSFVEYTKNSVLIKDLFAKIVECACNGDDVGDIDYVVHISGSDDNTEFELYKSKDQIRENDIIIGEVPNSVIDWILNNINAIE